MLLPMYLLPLNAPAHVLITPFTTAPAPVLITP